eukprot:4819421-Prymnesium_polylepis.2
MQSFRGHDWFGKYRTACHRLVAIAEEMDGFGVDAMPTNAEAGTWLKWKAGKASKKRDADGLIECDAAAAVDENAQKRFVCQALRVYLPFDDVMAKCGELADACDEKADELEEKESDAAQERGARKRQEATMWRARYDDMDGKLEDVFGMLDGLRAGDVSAAVRDAMELDDDCADDY